jgi:hypothetical protein
VFEPGWNLPSNKKLSGPVLQLAQVDVDALMRGGQFSTALAVAGPRSQKMFSRGLPRMLGRPQHCWHSFGPSHI